MLVSDDKRVCEGLRCGNIVQARRYNVHFFSALQSGRWLDRYCGEARRPLRTAQVLHPIPTFYIHFYFHFRSLSFNFIAFKINSSQNSFRCFTSSCNVFRSSLVLNFPGLQESTDGPVGADLYRACLYSNSQSDPRCKSGKQTNLNNEQWTPRVFTNWQY